MRGAGLSRPPSPELFSRPLLLLSLQRFSGREELLWGPDSSLVGAVPAYAGDPCPVEKEAPEEKEL